MYIFLKPNLTQYETLNKFFFVIFILKYIKNCTKTVEIDNKFANKETLVEFCFFILLAGQWYKHTFSRQCET